MNIEMKFQVAGKVQLNLLSMRIKSELTSAFNMNYICTQIELASESTEFVLNQH